MKEKVGIQSGSPLELSCKNCGAPVGFDIVRQTYRCSHCGELTGIQKVQRDDLHWKMLQKENTRADFPGNRLEECDCPSCGAKIIFQEGEASETCDFCGSRLVRKELTEEGEMPELIIPFFITFEEARRRMLDWGACTSEHTGRKECCLRHGQIQRLLSALSASPRSGSWNHKS